MLNNARITLEICFSTEVPLNTTSTGTFRAHFYTGLGFDAESEFVVHTHIASEKKKRKGTCFIARPQEPLFLSTVPVGRLNVQLLQVTHRTRQGL